MGDLLVPIEFALEMLPSLEQFTYGREPWEVYLYTWLMKGSADAIGSNGAKVWVYINQADEYVGYGSLAQSLLRYPRKTSDMVPVVDIPAFAVRDDLWGKPKEDRLDDVTVDGRYSSQIMRHLIDTAASWDGNFPAIKLSVDQRATKAHEFYERFGFERSGKPRVDGDATYDRYVRKLR